MTCRRDFLIDVSLAAAGAGNGKEHDPSVLCSDTAASHPAPNIIVRSLGIHCISDKKKLKRSCCTLRSRPVADNQYEWNQQLLHRITKLENGADRGRFVPTASIMGE